MAEPVITIRDVAKQYAIGRGPRVRKTFREMLMDSVSAPGRRLRELAGRGRAAERFWALQGIDLDIYRGDIVGLIGRNGAGKSTLLKILSRITAPTRGRIEIRGRLSSLLEVGTGFHQELTGRENIFLNGAILGMTRREIARKFDEIVAFADIGQFLDTPVKYYSSGMYVRLAFAVAAHLESEILVVDEVLAVGDAAFQKKCLAKMGDVAGAGRTVLFVSHNMAAIRTLCRRGIVLQSGRVVEDSDVATAIDTYLKTDASNDASIVWPEATAPRSADVRLRKAYVLDRAGSPAGILNCSDEFSIALEYEVLRPVRDMRIGFIMQNLHGTEICGSSDWGAWEEGTRAPGLYRSVCRMPAHVLNNGRYSVSFAVDKAPHLGIMLKTDYCISFDLEDIEGHGPRSHHQPGVLRPKLSWHGVSLQKELA